MAPRPLGRTGLSLSPLGYGAFKIGRNEGTKYPQAYPLPDERTVEQLLNGVLDLGIRYIDTAPAYGLSEERIGRCIAHRRAEFVLSTKAGETFENGRSAYDFSAAALRASVERSLKRLRTDTVDILFLHAPADDMAVVRDTDALATLHELRSQGKCRFIGFSGKTIAAERLALPHVNVLMVEYHLEDQSHRDVMREAAARGAGVIVKKGLASGRLAADEAIRFVLADPNVGSLVVGGLNLEHIRANLRSAG